MVLRWLLPLGMLGFLALAALLIIYIIKPKHKQKEVSSTFVWKRALQNRKKKIPFDLWNNLLVIILQAVVLSCATLILAQPYLFSESIVDLEPEYVYIIDASANMRAEYADESAENSSRFERAIEEIKINLKQAFLEDCTVSIILADDEPHYIAYGVGKNGITDIEEALNSAECSFGTGDVEEALLMAQQRLYHHPSTKIYLYTGTDYGDMGTALTVVNLADAQREWNIAILGCEVGVQDNEYVFNITVGAYGDVTAKYTLSVDIKGADNYDGQLKNFPLEVPVTFAANANSSTHESVQTIAVRATDVEYGGMSDWVFDTYEEVNIEFKGLRDSIADDNVFKVYGGYKDVINVQYWSSEPNVFWQFAVNTLSNNMRRTRRITIKEIYEGQNNADGPIQASNSGYDIYIFEHSIPQEIIEKGLPKDGVIIIADPNATLAQFDEIGLTLGSHVNFSALTPLDSRGVSHSLLQYFNPANLGVTQYTRITSIDDSDFIPVLYCGEDPVMLVKNTGSQKVVVMPFSINMSNFYGRELMTFMYNLVNYFMPYTLTDYDYTIGESAAVDCKGVSVSVRSERGTTSTISRFPTKYTFSEIGTYTFTTRFELEKDNEIRKVYVHMPSSESSLFNMSEFRILMNNEEVTGEMGTDIFLYFAIAMLVLLAVEWCLQFKEIV